MPSLAIEEDKILSIQASKSGTGDSISVGGRSAGCWCWRGASAQDWSGVLLQPTIQLSDTSRHSLLSFEKRILGLRQCLVEGAYTLGSAVLLRADGARAGQLHRQQVPACSGRILSRLGAAEVQARARYEQNCHGNRPQPGRHQVKQGQDRSHASPSVTR